MYFGNVWRQAYDVTMKMPYSRRRRLAIRQNEAQQKVNAEEEAKMGRIRSQSRRSGRR